MKTKLQRIQELVLFLAVVFIYIYALSIAENIG